MAEGTKPRTRKDSPNNRPTKTKHNEEIFWKLVSERRSQLADAITAARYPFFLGLTWSFIWFSALYSDQATYTHLMLERAIARSAIYSGTDLTHLASDNILAKERTQKALNLCLDKNNRANITLYGNTHELTKEWRFENCKNEADMRYQALRKAEFDAMWTQLPFGLGRLHISDFGIMGNVGLILILAWSGYAYRRENHSVRSFVDFDEAERKTLPLIPREFSLVPKDNFLAPEHYVFGYYAVAQRFMFLFSTHSRPLFAATIALGSLPAAVSLLHFATDAQSLWAAPEKFEPQVYIRFTVEVALTTAVLFLTMRIMRHMIETGVLLNGWLLAVRDVWLNDWADSTTDGSAALATEDSGRGRADEQLTHAVLVNVTRQIATPLKQEETISRGSARTARAD